MIQTPPTNNKHFVVVLSTLRQEWQEAANGNSLLNVEGNIALILADLINSFGLTPNEQSQVLGADLFGEIQELLVIRG